MRQLEEELTCVIAEKDYYMNKISSKKEVECRETEAATILTLEDLVSIEHQLAILPELKTSLESSYLRVK